MRVHVYHCGTHKGGTFHLNAIQFAASQICVFHGRRFQSGRRKISVDQFRLLKIYSVKVRFVGVHVLHVCTHERRVLNFDAVKLCANHA